MKTDNKDKSRYFVDENRHDGKTRDCPKMRTVCARKSHRISKYTQREKNQKLKVRNDQQEAKQIGE